MQGRISSLIPFFLITILSVVAVEGAYQALEFFVLRPSATAKKDQKQQPKKIEPQKDVQGGKPDYRIIVERNLFGSPATDPVAETVETSPEDTAKNLEELGIVLMGTISGSDNNNRAIILTRQTQDQELFSAGEVIEGALIKEIQRGKLVLSIDGKDEVLDMSEASKMRPAYTAPPAPTPNNAAPPQLGGENPPANINAAPTPRRRVIRRPRAPQNTPRRPQQ